jgi:hypothetical protein
MTVDAYNRYSPRPLLFGEEARRLHPCRKGFAPNFFVDAGMRSSRRLLHGDEDEVEADGTATC